MYIRFRRLLKKLYLFLLPLYHKLYVLRLRHKKEINVVFFAMSLPMWRYQHIYELLRKHPRFNPYVVIVPSISYTEHQQHLDESALIQYFDKTGVTYLLGRLKNGSYLNVKKELSPDILFYPQPYSGYYPNEIAFSKFYNKLLCYCPYAFWSSDGEWSYNQPLHKVAWKLFYSTELHRRDLARYSLRKSKNVEIVGYPTADEFMSGKYIDVWKKQKTSKKRIIWAPHFTIKSNGFLYQSNFLWMAELMLSIAKKYHDKIQFVFKPHPRLFSELCNHDSWGEDRVREYYHLWETMDNTQIETGNFVDLFMTSDAMIHDCGSFSIEYHYSTKPVMYIAQNFEEQVVEKNELGKMAMRCHYVGKSSEDIIKFIEEVVIGGIDPIKSKRESFRDECLLPPNGKSVAENVMEIFHKSFC